jgi:hypothetical protein
MVACCRRLARRLDRRVERAMSRDDDLVAKVREVLEACAGAGKMISFSEIETRIGEKVVAWNKVLDRIYEELRALGKPDLTSIVIYKTGNQQGYPPFSATAARRGRSVSTRTISNRSNAGRRKLVAFSRSGARKEGDLGVGQLWQAVTTAIKLAWRRRLAPVQCSRQPLPMN